MIGSSMMSNGKWKLKTPNEKMANNTRTRQTKQKSDENTYTKIPKYTLSNSSKASLNSALRSSSRLVPILFFFTKINICMIWKLKSLTYSVPPPPLFTFPCHRRNSESWVTLFVHRTRDNWGLGWGDTKESHIHSKYGNAKEKYKEKSISIFKLCWLWMPGRLKFSFNVHI